MARHIDSNQYTNIYGGFAGSLGASYSAIKYLKKSYYEGKGSFKEGCLFVLTGWGISSLLSTADCKFGLHGRIAAIGCFALIHDEVQSFLWKHNSLKPKKRSKN